MTDNKFPLPDAIFDDHTACSKIEMSQEPILQKATISPDERNARIHALGDARKREAQENHTKAAPSRAVQSTESGEDMPSPQRKLLRVLAQYQQGRTKKQLAVLAGYSHNGGAFNNPLSNLRAKGWAKGSHENITITNEGLQALGPSWEPLPIGIHLQAYWFENLEGPQAKLLRALCEVYPDGMTKHELAAATDYEPNGGAFNNPLSRLRALELITGRGGEPLKASEELFG